MSLLSLLGEMISTNSCQIFCVNSNGCETQINDGKSELNFKIKQKMAKETLTGLGLEPKTSGFTYQLWDSSDAQECYFTNSGSLT